MSGNMNMEVVENASIFPSFITDSLGKIVDMDNMFSMNNIILFVSIAITLVIVGIKMKLIPTDSLEKIPIVRNFLPAKKQVEFEPNQDDDDEDDDEEDDEVAAAADAK
jgi:hypothetical protein